MLSTIQQLILYMDSDQYSSAQNVEDEEIAILMEDHDIDEEQAENVIELMDDLGIDESDALEISESM